MPGITDTLLVASVRVTLCSRAGGAPHGGLSLRVRDELSGPHWRPWDAVPAPGAAWTWENGARRARASCSAVSPTRRRGVCGAVTARTSASAPSRRPVAPSFECWLADRPLPPAEADRIAKKLRHDDHTARTRTLWRDWLGRGAVFETPDTLVNMAWRAALVTLLQGHERSAGGWVPLGNPFQYRDTWLRDGARVVRALALAGQGELARADALTFTRYQLPSGALVSQPGQLDGTGQALWAFEQAAALPPDPAWAKRYLAAAVRGGAVAAAAAGSFAHARGQDARGLAGPAALRRPARRRTRRRGARRQRRGRSRGRCCSLPSWARAGDASASEAARAEAASHRAAFGAALEREAHADVPPSWGEGGRDWGNCYVGFPTRVLAPGDPRLAALARRLWARSGLHMVSYGPADSLHSYLGTDLAVWALLAGRPADARASLADLLAHSSATLGQAEIFSRSGRGFGGNLPPHGTAAAQFVELLRDIVVLDVRGSLEIAAGADAAWWAGTHLRGAPTRFGVLDLSLSRPAAGRFEAKWAGSGSARSAGAPVRVRVPDGFTLVRAEGGTADPADARWVACPATATGVTLFVKEAP